MYVKVGETPFKISSPVKFMAGFMALLTDKFTLLVFKVFNDNSTRCTKILRAIDAVSTLSLLIMLMKWNNVIANRLLPKNSKDFLIFGYEQNALY